MAGSLRPPGLEVGWRGGNGIRGGAATKRGRILRIPSEEKIQGKRWVSSRAGLNGFGPSSGLDFSKIIEPKPGTKLESYFQAGLGRDRAQLNSISKHRDNHQKHKSINHQQ